MAVVEARYIVPVLFRDIIPAGDILPKSFQGIRLFCRKSIVGRILKPTNGINNEEALE